MALGGSGGKGGNGGDGSGGGIYVSSGTVNIYGGLVSTCTAVGGKGRPAAWAGTGGKGLTGLPPPATFMASMAVPEAAAVQEGRRNGALAAKEVAGPFMAADNLYVFNATLWPIAPWASWRRKGRQRANAGAGR